MNKDFGRYMSISISYAQTMKDSHLSKTLVTFAREASKDSLDYRTQSAAYEAIKNFAHIVEGQSIPLPEIARKNGSNGLYTSFEDLEGLVEKNTLLSEAIMTIKSRLPKNGFARNNLAENDDHYFHRSIAMSDRMMM